MPPHHFFIYSVMQSDGNSFYGDVVLESCNEAFRDIDSTLYQQYEDYEDFNFKSDWGKCILKEIQPLTTRKRKMGFSATAVLMRFRFFFHCTSLQNM